jgi:hypothetical protein
MAKGISSICMDFVSARKLLEVIGGELRPNETTTTWLHRIGEAVGLEYRVVRAVWHGERLSRETAYKLKLAAKDHDNINRTTIERLERSAQALLDADAEMFSEEAALRRQLASVLRDYLGVKN